MAPVRKPSAMAWPIIAACLLPPRNASPTAGSAEQIGRRPVHAVAALDEHVAAVRDRAAPPWRSAPPSARRRRCFASWRRLPKTSPTILGERPAVGSSSIRTGRVGHQRARDREHLALSARQHAAERGAPLRQHRELPIGAREPLLEHIRGARVCPPRMRFSWMVRSVKTFPVCGTKPRPDPHHLMGRQPGDFLPGELDSPPSKQRAPRSP